MSPTWEVVMGALALLFMLVAVVLFLIAAFAPTTGRFNLVAAGLACLTFALLLQGAGDVEVNTD